MEYSCASRCFEAIASHDFEGVLAQSGAICRNEDAAISLR
jgi:hypothetical protein